MKIIGVFLSTIFLLFVNSNGIAQSNKIITKTIDDLNRSLDRAVVNKDTNTLNKHYGDDFVFTHGTGLVDSKDSWINNIKRIAKENRFISREHDSTQVELHGDIAIIVGTLTVERLNQKQVQKYALRYVRVYVLRNEVWELISHRTTKEWHL